MNQLISYDIKIYTDLNLGIFNPTQTQLHNSFLFNFKEKTKNDGFYLRIGGDLELTNLKRSLKW